MAAILLHRCDNPVLPEETALQMTIRNIKWVRVTSLQLCGWQVFGAYFGTILALKV